VPFSVVTDQIGNPTYTGDLAEAVTKLVRFLARATQGAENRIYHIANKGTVSRFEFARLILAKKNYSPGLVKPITTDAAPPRPATRPQNSCLSTEKIKERFGIDLRHWEKALDSYLQEDMGLKV